MAPQVPGFQVAESLGSGGMGSVYRALGPDGREVALKIIPFPEARADAVRTRVRREAKALMELRHPRVVRVFDYLEEPDRAVLVLELLRGESLREHLIRRSHDQDFLNWTEVAHVAAALTSALADAHQAGWVHRDLKPSNVMLVDRRLDQAKLLDFGIAKALEPDGTHATTQGRRIGSLTYMAPEQLRSEPISVQTDLFSLGVILFELVTLRRPWLVDEKGVPLSISTAQAPSLALKRKNPPGQIMARILDGSHHPRPSGHRQVPDGLDQVLEHLMQVDPDQRPRSVLHFMEQLREVLPLEDRTVLSLQTRLVPPPGVETLHPTPSPLGSVSKGAASDLRTRRPPSRWSLIFLLAAGIGGGFAGGLWFSEFDPQAPTPSGPTLTEPPARGPDSESSPLPSATARPRPLALPGSPPSPPTESPKAPSGSDMPSPAPSPGTGRRPDGRGPQPANLGSKSERRAPAGSSAEPRTMAEERAREPSAAEARSNPRLDSLRRRLAKLEKAPDASGYRRLIQELRRVARDRPSHVEEVERLLAAGELSGSLEGVRAAIEVLAQPE